MSINALKRKRGELRNIIRRCEMVASKQDVQNIDANGICSSISLFIFAVFYMASFFDINLSSFAAAFMIGLTWCFKPYIRKKRRSPSELMYTAVFKYVSPLQLASSTLRRDEMKKILIRGDIEDCYVIREWARNEIKEINEILYINSREGEIREMLIEEIDNSDKKSNKS